MSIAVARINDLILEQLAHREMRLLSLVVAIRKGFGGNEAFKGDLSARVQSTLRKLVAANVVIDMEGLYALAEQPGAGARKTPGVQHA